MKTKNIIRIVVVTAFILLIPFVAMQFSDDVKWGASDFVFIGALLIGSGLLYEFVATKIRNPKHRAVIGIVLVATLLLVWAELAVGIFETPFAGS